MQKLFTLFQLIFMLKNWEKLLQCKSFSHLFNKKYWCNWDINVWNFNKMLTDNVVSFEQLDPRRDDDSEVFSARKLAASLSIIRGGIKKFWASGIFPIQIVQCFTPNVQKCVRYWLHLGSYCWLSLFSHNTWSKIHTPIELAKWTKLSTERW